LASLFRPLKMTSVPWVPSRSTIKTFVEPFINSDQTNPSLTR
jgi:hypothetical protein